MEGIPAAADEVGKILQHRSTERGTLQFRVQSPNPDGDVTICKWLDSVDVAPSARRAYELGRLPEKGPVDKKRKQRARTGATATQPEGSHVLAEDELDCGECGIDKSTQGTRNVKKWQRRRLGGVIAAVSGCRLFLDWEEHQFGEGTSQVYVVLAGVMATILNSIAANTGGSVPRVVFMDNACALWKYATNPKRCDRTPITMALKGLHYMLDIWHVVNHSACLRDPMAARALDPRHEANTELRANINTEACEQCFSFLDRISYLSLNMGPGTMGIYLYLLFDL